MSSSALEIKCGKKEKTCLPLVGEKWFYHRFCHLQPGVLWDPPQGAQSSLVSQQPRYVNHCPRALCILKKDNSWKNTKQRVSNLQQQAY